MSGSTMERTSRGNDLLVFNVLIHAEPGHLRERV